MRRHPPEARIAPCIGSFNTEPTPSIGERSQQLHPPPRNLDRPARSGAPGRYLDKVRSPPTPNLGGRQRSDGGPVPDFGDLPEIFQVSSITRADDYPCPAVEASRGSDGRQSWNYDKCADVTGRSTTPGALVHQWDCANDDHQLWAPVNIGNGLVQLVNRHSGLCMDVRNDMGDIQQYDCWTGIASESWQVVHLDVSSTVELISSPGKCLEVKNASRSNGAKIRVSECNTASNAQRWEFQ